MVKRKGKEGRRQRGVSAVRLEEAGSVRRMDGLRLRLTFSSRRAARRCLCVGGGTPPAVAGAQNRPFTYVAGPAVAEPCARFSATTRAARLLHETSNALFKGWRARKELADTGCGRRTCLHLFGPW
eukprot:351545-Chlamydomonas_euryale.AAC.2